MMPWIHDALWFGLFAALAVATWKAAVHFRVPAVDLRRPFRFVAQPSAGTWVPAARSSGNSAFDEWRDGEIARLDGERQVLESKLHAFEAFVDKLRRAKDRETFDRFMTSFREIPAAGAAMPEDLRDHHPA